MVVFEHRVSPSPSTHEYEHAWPGAPRVGYTQTPSGEHVAMPSGPGAQLGVEVQGEPCGRVPWKATRQVDTSTAPHDFALPERRSMHSFARAESYATWLSFST